jgi:Protein of unknown function (DUF5661)
MTEAAKQQLYELFKRGDREAFLKLLYDKYEEPMNGGKADGHHPREFNSDQLLKGIQIEFEHGKGDVLRATKISLDHLCEIDDYYDRLQAMEAQAKKEGHDNKDSDEKIINEIKKSFQQENYANRSSKNTI